MTATLRRDPYARGEMVREVAHVNGPGHRTASCSWCGQTPRRLHRYGWSADQRPRPSWSVGLFCNVGCFDSWRSP